MEGNHGRRSIFGLILEGNLGGKSCKEAKILKNLGRYIILGTGKVIFGQIWEGNLGRKPIIMMNLGGGQNLRVEISG